LYTYFNWSFILVWVLNKVFLCVKSRSVSSSSPGIFNLLFNIKPCVERDYMNPAKRMQDILIQLKIARVININLNTEFFDLLLLLFGPRFVTLGIPWNHLHIRSSIPLAAKILLQVKLHTFPKGKTLPNHIFPYKLIMWLLRQVQHVSLVELSSLSPFLAVLWEKILILWYVC